MVMPPKPQVRSRTCGGYALDRGGRSCRDDWLACGAWSAVRIGTGRESHSLYVGGVQSRYNPGPFVTACQTPSIRHSACGRGRVGPLGCCGHCAAPFATQRGPNARVHPTDTHSSSSSYESRGRKAHSGETYPCSRHEVYVQSRTQLKRTGSNCNGACHTLQNQAFREGPERHEVVVVVVRVERSKGP